MSNNTVCDFNCQRKKNVTELKTLYNNELSNYINFGRSATVAVLIFVCVLPIIIGTAIREKENAQS